MSRAARRVNRGAAGNHTPDIRFSLSPGNGVMAPFVFTTNQPNAAGAIASAWNAIPTATAYGLFAFGQGQASENDLVVWTSSELASFDQGMHSLPPRRGGPPGAGAGVVGPANHPLHGAGAGCAGHAPRAGRAFRHPVRRSVRAGAKLRVPAPSHGRPHPLNQQWAVKARFSSSTVESLGLSMTTMMAGRDGAGMPGAGVPGAPPLSQGEICRRKEEARRAQARDVGRTVGGALGIPGGNIVGGLFGGAQKAPADPDCQPPGAPAKKALTPQL
jgi:hypothetical protein